MQMQQNRQPSQALMQQQMQQQYQPRGQMPRQMQGQSQQMFQNRQPQTQQQFPSSQQYQQPSRQQIQAGANYQGGSQGFQGPNNMPVQNANSGEWEQFFSQSNPNPAQMSSRPYPGGGASQFNSQTQQANNFGPPDSYRGGMMMSPEPVMQSYPGRGPRGAPMQGRGRGTGRGGFDQNIAGRGFSGRGPRGMVQPELALNEYGKSRSLWD